MNLLPTRRPHYGTLRLSRAALRRLQADWSPVESPPLPPPMRLTPEGAAPALRKTSLERWCLRIAA